jgi:hypothetical protein
MNRKLHYVDADVGATRAFAAPEDMPMTVVCSRAKRCIDAGFGPFVSR